MVVAIHELDTNRSKHIIQLSFYYVNEIGPKNINYNIISEHRIRLIHIIIKRL